MKRFSSPNPTYTELWSSPEAVTAGHQLYFIIQLRSTTGPGAGYAQLWRTNGSTQGTLWLTEPLTYGDEGPIPELFTVGDSVLFAALENLDVADPRQHGRELWTTRGTVPNTHLLQDLRPGHEWGNPSSFVRAGRYVYFVALDVADTFRLWAIPAESAGCSKPL